MINTLNFCFEAWGKIAEILEKSGNFLRVKSGNPVDCDHHKYFTDRQGSCLKVMFSQMTVCPRGGVEYLGYLLSHVPPGGRVTLPTLDTITPRRSRGYFGRRYTSYRNACLFVFNASKTGYDVYFRKGLTNRKAYKPPPDVEDRVERITSPHCEAGQDWRRLELTDPTLKFKVSMLEHTDP